MSHGVSIAHAKKVARRAPETCITTAKVDDEGRLRTDIPINLREAGLRQGRQQDVRVLLFESGSVCGGRSPKPIPAQDGKGAFVIPLTIRPRERQEVASLRVSATLTEQAGKWVDIAVERVRPNLVSFAVVAIAAIAAIAAITLARWGDPTARKGHYEGKSTSEIQADLDQDIAWYEMEISVASCVTMTEGDTACELRVENVESNHCDQKVRVWESGDEGDILFESGAIAPGEYLQTVELAHPLDVGIHTLTVQFQGYEQSPTLMSDEGQILGHDTFGASCAAEVTVEVVPTSA